MNLEGKRILLIAPHFHEYHIEITKILRGLDANVTFYEEVFYSRVYTLIRDKLFSPLNKILDNLYFARILKSIQSNEYDIFFLIRGGLITDEFLQMAKETSPHAYCVMYQWDSMVHNDYKSKIKYFDKAYTFDKYDANNLKINYLPLFYTNDYANIKNTQSDLICDVCFFGTYHSDRLHIIKAVAMFCEKNKLKFEYHLYAGRINISLLLLQKKIKFSDIKYFKSHTVTLSEIIKQYSVSKAVLDIEMTNQTGLTMRTIEALGSGRKLLTTNINIKESEVFDENFVQVLDRTNPTIDSEWLNSPLPSSDKYDQYHISKWISQIMSVD